MRPANAEPTHAECRDTWQRVPVDDVAYVPADDLLAMPAEELRALIDGMAATRYDEGRWRNWRGLWWAGMNAGLSGRVVLDYGCGVGLEARSLTRLGNAVIAADINPESACVAERVVRMDGHGLAGARVIRDEAPFVQGVSFDVFYCNGVLHHIPWAQDVLTWAASELPSWGEMRLMVYTDRARDRCAAQGVPLGDGMDFAGVYADWYDEERLSNMLPTGWRVDRWEYITPSGEYATARVVACG